MRHTAPARATTGKTLRATLLNMFVVTAAVIGTLAWQSASSSAPASSEVVRDDHAPSTTETDSAVTQADGALPDGVTVFDEEYPGIANLDPDLLQAMREAATDAADNGIEIHVNSGWRSQEYQDELLRAAVSKYGSAREAARWVATADMSAHVTGDAIDIGPLEATAWLGKHGAEHGLCQIYSNEPWHYELRPEAIGGDCPSMHADSAHDPNLHE